MQPKTKYSRQRLAILNELKSRCDHPTADVIYAEVRKTIPNISLGTVYRNLGFLAQNGDILKIPATAGSEHFDGNPAPHYHFKCNICGNVSDVALDLMPNLTEMAGNLVDGVVTGHSIMFEGKCGLCADTCKK